MQRRRDMFGAAAIVGSVWSALATSVVIALDAVGAAPRPVLVVAVIGIGFAASWTWTGRIARTPEPGRATAIGARRPVA